MPQDPKDPPASDLSASAWYKGTQRIDPPAIDPTLPVPAGATLVQRAQHEIARKHGSRSAQRHTVIRDAIRRALYKRTKDGRRKLEALAEQMVDDAMTPATGPYSAGISAARKELLDRVAGKPIAATEHSGPDGQPIAILIGPADTKVL